MVAVSSIEDSVLVGLGYGRIVAVGIATALASDQSGVTKTASVHGD